MIDDPTLAELEAKHTWIRVLDYQGHTIVLRKPTQAEFDCFQDAVFDDRKRRAGISSLARALIVYPSGERIEAIRAEYPAFLHAIGMQAAEWAGLVQAEIRK